MAQIISPLFTPVLWKGDHFKVLDETHLPWKVEYVTVRRAQEAVEIVREMKTRAFGQVLTFLYSAALVALKTPAATSDELGKRLNELAQEFTQARPTFNFMRHDPVFQEWLRQYGGGEGLGPWFVSKIHELIGKTLQSRIDRAKRTADLLPNPCRLLTHCNISGELVAVAQQCKELGKELQIVASETRPYLQGARLTAWELAQAGFKVTLIPDCAIAQVMDKGQVDIVLVGSDRSALNGDIVNKVGTYPLALMAKEFGIPFYVLVQNPGPLASGREIPIEERPVEELLSFQGRSITAEGVQGRYPAFDVTPASLITTLIGYDGAYTPAAFKRKYDNGSTHGEKTRGVKKRLLLLYGIPNDESYAYFPQVLKAERAQGLVVPEMRPQLWGAREVAGELVKRGIPTTLITDNMMGTIFAREEICRLFLFHREFGEKGPVGICGALLAAWLARIHGVPIELLASGEARRLPMDDTVATFLDQEICPSGVIPYPIERDVIPWSFFKRDQGRLL